MARQYPLSEVACDSDALNVEYDIVGETPRHPGLGPNDARVATRTPLVDEMELDNSSSDVGGNIGSCTEQLVVMELGDGNVPDVGPAIGSWCFTNNVMVNIQCVAITCDVTQWVLTCHSTLIRGAGPMMTRLWVNNTFGIQ